MAGSRPSPAKSSAKRGRSLAGVGAVIAMAASVAPALAQEGLRPYVVVDNAIPESLTGAPGDPARGRAIVGNRQTGLCLLCHSGPFPEEKFQGTLAPDLKGAGARWSEGELRLRIVDAARLNPETIMPPYYRVEGLTRVAGAHQGKGRLNPEEAQDHGGELTTQPGPREWRGG